MYKGHYYFNVATTFHFSPDPITKHQTPLTRHHCSKLYITAGFHFQLLFYCY
jgi:hypothetical protein